MCYFVLGLNFCCGIVVYRLLQEFVEKHGNELEVIYSLSGWLKNNSSDYHIRLVSKHKLAGFVCHMHCFILGPFINIKLRALISFIYTRIICISLFASTLNLYPGRKIIPYFSRLLLHVEPRYDENMKSPRINVICMLFYDLLSFSFSKMNAVTYYRILILNMKQDHKEVCYKFNFIFKTRTCASSFPCTYSQIVKLTKSLPRLPVSPYVLSSQSPMIRCSSLPWEENILDYPEKENVLDSYLYSISLCTCTSYLSLWSLGVYPPHQGKHPSTFEEAPQLMPLHSPFLT